VRARDAAKDRTRRYEPRAQLACLARKRREVAAAMISFVVRAGFWLERQASTWSSEKRRWRRREAEFDLVINRSELLRIGGVGLAFVWSLSFGCSLAEAQGLGPACGPASRGGLSVLVAPFGLEKALSAKANSSEVVLQTATAMSLLEVPGTTATVRETKAPAAQPSIADRIRSQFSRGLSADEPLPGELVTDLKALGCDLVIGGVVLAAGITPYLIDVSNGTVEQPFTSVSFRRADELVQLGRNLGESFSGALAHHTEDKRRSSIRFWIGCFGPAVDAAKALPISTDELIHAVARGLAAATEVHVVESHCEPVDLRRLAETDKTALFSGIVSRDGKAVQPRFDFLIREGAPITLRTDPKLLGPGGRDALSQQYLNEAATFVVALKSQMFQEALYKQGMVRQDQAETARLLFESVENLLSERRSNTAESEDKVARVFSAGYQALNASPSNLDTASLAHYVLGAGLLARSEPQLAISQLTRSFDLSLNLPANNAAQRHEVTALAYSALGAHNSAISELEEASKKYKAAFLKQYLRVRKSIGTERLTIKDYDDARADFETIPESARDFTTLVELGDAYLGLGDADKALTIYLQAMGTKNTIEVGAASVVRGKLAKIYFSLAQGTSECKSKEQYYREASRQEYNPEYAFKAGITAYSQEEYGPAISDFEAIVNNEANASTSFWWLQSAWLDLIESEILVGRLSKAEMDAARAANEIFVHSPDAQFLATYLRAIARAVDLEDFGKGPLTEDKVYQATISQANELREASPEKKLTLNWDNKKLAAFYREKLNPNSERLRALVELEHLLNLTTQDLTPPSNASSCPR
jgi:tetratricopeptide (TPR) repeat protein